jgi:hypothetical protein
VLGVAGVGATPARSVAPVGIARGGVEIKPVGADEL